MKEDNRKIITCWIRWSFNSLSPCIAAVESICFHIVSNLPSFLYCYVLYHFENSLWFHHFHLCVLAAPLMCPSWSVPSLSVVFICSVIFVAIGNVYLGAVVAEAVESIRFFSVVSPWIQARTWLVLFCPFSLPRQCNLLSAIVFCITPFPTPPKW